MTYLQQLTTDPRTSTAFTDDGYQPRPNKPTVKPSKVFYVYADDVDEGEYVAADDAHEACQIAANCNGIPASRFTARYLITSSNPTKTIAELWARKAGKR